MAQVRYCIQCGGELAHSDKFCGHCGRVIGSASATDEGRRSWASGSDFNGTSFVNLSHLKYLYLSHSGRINRGRYLAGWLFLWLIFGLIATLVGAIFETDGTVYGLFMFPSVGTFFYSGTMLMVKRAHDLNHSFVWTLIPVWAELFLLFKSGTAGSNKYGPNPSTYETPIY